MKNRPKRVSGGCTVRVRARCYHSYHSQLDRYLVLCILTLVLGTGPLGCALPGAHGSAQPSSRTIQVGKYHPVKTIAAAAQLARDGDTVEITAGDYEGDTAVWTQSNLTIRGIHGRPRLIATGTMAEDKAIWVIRGHDIVVEDIEFIGARAPTRNGAGIRFERGKLTVRRCIFRDNETGMLVGNDESTVLKIEDSEFGDNGAGDGQSHNLYVGTIQRFLVKGSYFHGARVGHLLKTRAKESFIYYNRLTDESGGRSSYELEFPIGGFAVVVGNLIEQSQTTENPRIIAFGAEGYKWPRNELYLSHNTIVNERPSGGDFIWARPGSAYVKAVNNLFVGNGDLNVKTRADIEQNWRVDRSEFIFSDPYDFRLRADSTLIGVATNSGESGGDPLRPKRQYSYPVGTVARTPDINLTPGAFQ